MTAVVPAVLGVGTAVPPHVLPQSEARAFAGRFFRKEFPELDRLLRAFDNTGIVRRHLACPVEWYDEPHSFPEKNSIYARTVIELSERASRDALLRADIDPAAVRGIVFSSTTGIATPSLDSHLVQLLDLPRDIARVPLWGLGCAGGGGGLARAASLSKALGGPVLLVSAEVCSTTFVHEDRSKSNLIATALFGDGAAAAVVGPGPGPQLLTGVSHLVDDSEDVMGWILEPTGLKVRFARSIPALIREIAPKIAEQAARSVGAQRQDLVHWVFHPGGAKVLRAYEDSLGLDSGALDLADEVLRGYGNMSGPTVLFVLERFMERVPPRDGLGLLLGLGPGFSAEGVVFRW